MLLYADGNFIQYLEGEEDAVRQTFARIGRDPRHTGVLCVADGPLEQRVFADWEMGFKALDGAPAVEGHFPLTRAAIEAHMGDSAPALLTSMMRRFYQSTDRYAYS